MTDESQNFDPYRYGRPAPQPQPMSPHGGPPRGKEILRASWGLLRQDKELIALPVLGFVFTLLAFVVLFVPGFLLGRAAGADTHIAVYVGAVAGGFLASAVGLFFQAALVAGASQRADGGNPTLGSALSFAGQRWRQILGWAVLSATVGAVIRALERRLGVLGLLIGVLGGVAWAVASFFVVPVLIIEGVGPIEALKRSSRVIRDTWGTSVRTTLRLGAWGLMMIVPFFLVVAGAMVLLGGSAGAVAAGVVLLVVGVLAVLAFGVLFGAITTYARTVIYRYATGRPVPIDGELLAGAFEPKRRRDRR